MFCNGFSHSIQDTLQIIQLTRILNLDDNNLIFTIESFDINPIELIILRLLVTLAFQNLHYMNFITYQYRKESFEHTKTMTFVHAIALHQPTGIGSIKSRSYIIIDITGRYLIINYQRLVTEKRSYRHPHIFLFSRRFGGIGIK